MWLDTELCGGSTTRGTTCHRLCGCDSRSSSWFGPGRICGASCCSLMFDHVQLHHHVCHDVVMCSVSYLWTQVMQVYTPLFGGTVLVLVYIFCYCFSSHSYGNTFHCTTLENLMLTSLRSKKHSRHQQLEQSRGLFFIVSEQTNNIVLQHRRDHDTHTKTLHIQDEIFLNKM